MLTPYFEKPESVAIEYLSHKFWEMDLSLHIPDWINENAKLKGTYCLMTTTEGFIITETDCCHRINWYKNFSYRVSEDFVIKHTPTINPDGSQTIDPFPIGTATLSIEEMVGTITKEITELGQWIFSWGIKPRVRQNYLGLIQSAKKINFKGLFPVWGEGE